MGAEGLPYNIVDSEAWDAADPLVRARPELFTDEPNRVRRTVPPAAAPVVERATATPGIARGIAGRFQRASKTPDAAEGGSTPEVPEGSSQRW
jgi:hypothetical protein